LGDKGNAEAEEDVLELLALPVAMGKT